MVSKRWGFVVLLVGSVGAFVLVSQWLLGPGSCAAGSSSAGAVFRGRLEAPGIDPTRLEAIVRRLDSGEVVARVVLDPDGRFVLPELRNADHRLEIVLLENPALVLVHAEPVRPGEEEQLLRADVRSVLGPLGLPGGLVEPWER